MQSRTGPVRAFKEYVTQGWAEMSATLMPLAEGADLVLTGTTLQGVALNVAEYYGIPLVHYITSRRGSTATSFRSLPSPFDPVRDFGGLVDVLAHDQGC